MRWLPRCVLLALLSTHPASLAAQTVPKPAAATPAGVAMRDSVVDRIVGIYVSSADLKGAISVTGAGYGRVLVTCSSWEAQGWYANGEFRGVWQRPGAGADSTTPRTFGWLRFGRNPDASLSATFTDHADGAPRHEVWNWHGRFGARSNPGATSGVRGAPGTGAASTPDRDAGVQGSDDPLPRIGEEIDHLEELPEAITRVAPNYPDDARRRGIDGTVMVQALIGPEGTVRDARIAKSIPELDAAAIAAVMQWKFKPALSGGKPVAVWITVPLRFSLH